ncbi:MAG: D-alanine--D-alanine ligase [Ferruginibacter sp.]|nr:D-alanine--D-alanine ligase [Chitinophagaceae bacterium]
MDVKPTIAFITGGYSGESVISYQSAITIENNLDTNKFLVYKIDITPNEWFFEGDDGEKILVDKNDFSIVVKGKKILFAAVLVGIHGTPAEDGKLLGYFDLLNLPYTGCDAAVSAITFNKRYTVAVASFAGINVARSLHIFKQHPATVQLITDTLQLPVFVKPNNGGSSIGMSKVFKVEDLSSSLEKAFKEDDQLLIEEFISGREFTVGVFRNKGEIITLPITEVLTTKDFFDYEAKYTVGKSEEITPAEVEETIAGKIRATARKVYEIFNCRGVVRIDFIYNEKAGAPYMLEINTVPGQSDASIVPKQIKAMGWTLKEFYTVLIEEALERRQL